MESHLDICLRGSTISCDEGFPILRPDSGVTTLHEHCEVEQQTVRLEENYDRQVWELMVALWGNIPSLDDSCKYLTFALQMDRRYRSSPSLEIELHFVRCKVTFYLTLSLEPNGNKIS